MFSIYKLYILAKKTPEQTSGFSSSDLINSKMFFSVFEQDEDQPTKLEHWQQETIKNFGDIKDSFTSRDLNISLHIWSPETISH